MFMKGSETLLTTSSYECTAVQTGKGEVIFKGVFTMDASDSSADNPVSFLKEAEYLLIEFEDLMFRNVAKEAKKKVLGGKVVCIVNNSVRFDFAIPAQTMHENKIFVRDLDKLKVMLTKSAI